MPGTEAALAERIRHALSWRLKARRLEQGATSDASLRGFYGTQTRLAEAALAQLRDEGQTKISAEGLRLQRLLAGEESFGSVEHCRERITYLNDLLRNEDPEALGGYIDLPLEDYPAAVRKGEKPIDPWAVFSVRGLLVVLACIALGAGLVLGYTMLQAGDVDLFIERPAFSNGPVPIIIENGGRSPIEVSVLPLLEGEQSMYLSVFARAAADQEFVLLPATPEAWDYPASGHGIQEGILIPPGLRAELTYSTAGLDTMWEGPLQLLRFELRRGDGRLVEARDLRWFTTSRAAVTPPAVDLPVPSAP